VAMVLGAWMKLLSSTQLVLVALSEHLWVGKPPQCATRLPGPLSLLPSAGWK